MRSATEERAAMVPRAVHRLAHLLTEGSNVTTTRIAGGAVRDMLLGVEPKDWDMASTLLPEAVMDKAERAGYTVIPTGLQHGTVTVVVDGMPLEVTTLRADVETDGRHADVEFITDWKEDAHRRDLTMNALFMDVDGIIFDYVGGVEDLKDGVVRFVGDAGERIQEDYLRILRYFRFVARVGSNCYDAEALSAIRRLSPNLNKISGERVWMEMSKILSGDLEVLDHMYSTGVLSAIGIDNPDMASAVAVNTMGGKPETVLAGLVGVKSVANSVADAWKLSRAERSVLSFVSYNGKLMTNTFSLRDWKVMVVTTGDKDLVLQAMCLTLNPNLVQDIKDWTVPTYPLTGADILAMGVESGPEVGRRLGLCKVKWMDSEFTMTKDELVELAAVV
jgi:hypothetical protein